MNETPEMLILIAGRADYPLLLARAAREQGVKRILAIAFKGETSREIRQVADEVTWLNVGGLAALLNTLRQSNVTYAVMAGQINPKNLFRVRMDSAFLTLLKRLPIKNAHTIFGAVSQAIEEIGIHLLPASSFMQNAMPTAGLLSTRIPTAREQNDIELGWRVIKKASHLEIGQTIVVKEGMILAIEAFEGTDQTIRRGGKLGGHGAVVVKIPKIGHDMRFDIPVIGLQTLNSLKKANISCLAIQADGAILLQKNVLIAQANAMGLSWMVLQNGHSAFDI